MRELKNAPAHSHTHTLIVKDVVTFAAQNKPRPTDAKTKSNVYNNSHFRQQPKQKRGREKEGKKGEKEGRKEERKTGGQKEMKKGRIEE